MSSSTLSRPLPSPVCRVFDHRPLRTDSDILALAFAPDGTLWSIEEVGMLRHWDLQEQRQLGWHTLSDMESLWTFSRDASILASATDELSFWDVATGHLQGVLPQASWVTALTLSGRGTLAATGHEDGTICLWDPLNDNQLLTLRGHICQVSALAFSADNSRLASAGEDKIVHLWDTRTGQECGILEGPCDRIPALVWHPQGHRLYAAGWDTSVWVWDTASGQPVILLNSHASQILAIAISSDGRHLACADSAPMIHVWDLANNRECCVFSGLEGETRSLVFSTDGQTLVSGGSDRVLHVWDYRRASEGNRAESRPASEVDVSSKPSVEVRTGLALMADGQRLASIYPGKGIRIWDTATREPLCDLGETGELCALACSSDGRWVASGRTNRGIRLWDGLTGQDKVTLEGSPLPITSLVFAPQGPVLAAASITSGDVWLWDIDRREAVLLIPDAVDGCSVEGLAFAPQGQCLAVAGVDWLATSGSDGAVHVWDLSAPHRIAVLPGGARGLAFHPAGLLLVTASLTRSVRVWEISSGRLAMELTGHDDTINCVACSPDGRLLASASDDRTVRLWDAQTGAPLGTTELNTQVKAICFTPDSLFLFTGNANTSCYQLDLRRFLNR